MSNLSHPKYRPDIDGLRAVAVLSVLGFHAFPQWMGGGFIGVDVFFVISGYLISIIVFESLERGAFSFSEFYARRIRRIFPALLLVLAACLVFGWFVLLTGEYAQLGKHTLSGAGFVSNLVLWGEAGYFDTSAETKVLLHLWSLGIEEQFYLIWPLLLWLAWRYRLNLLWVTALCAVISFALNMGGAGRDAVATFYSPQTRFWELLCGSLLAWLFVYGKTVRNRWVRAWHGWLAPTVHDKKGFRPGGQAFLNLLSLLGLLVLGLGFWTINKSMEFPGGWAVVPVLGTVLMILAGPGAWVNRKILSNRFVVWFGLISFPLYLWHWPLLSFTRIVEGEVPGRNLRIAAIVLSMILAWLTYRLVERPVRSGGRSRMKVAVLAVLMLIIGGSGFFLNYKEGLKSRGHIVEMASVNAEFVGPMWRFAKNDICQSKYPFAEASRYSWWFCTASSEAKPSLLLLGNSYANHLYAGFFLNDEFKHHSILSIGACDAGWVDITDNNRDAPTSPCFGRGQFNQQELINNIIVKEKSIRYAVLNGRYNFEEGYLERLKKRIDFLEKNNIKVIVFAPHPRLTYDIKSCYARPLKEAEKRCQISLETYADQRRNFNVLMEGLAKTNPDVLVFDQGKVFCDAQACKFKLPVMPAFRDEYSHYSEFASKLVIKEFAGWARTHAPDILAH